MEFFFFFKLGLHNCDLRARFHDSSFGLLSGAGSRVPSALLYLVDEWSALKTDCFENNAETLNAGAFTNITLSSPKLFCGMAVVCWRIATMMHSKTETTRTCILKRKPGGSKSKLSTKYVQLLNTLGFCKRL